ncbi:MAG: hypothetical protein FMNOHCHN_00633 [Ignavibacteriaceae bacterium]|nr:hypothetical protein [Ignavibacteriaceae bacterium]
MRKKVSDWGILNAKSAEERRKVRKVLVQTDDNLSPASKPRTKAPRKYKKPERFTAPAFVGLIINQSD